MIAISSRPIASSYKKRVAPFFGIPCFLFPIFAALAWLATLISMIATWTLRGSPHYPEMFPNQHLAYVSNVGATPWGQPIFIAGSTVMVIALSISIACERWLQYKGILLQSSKRRRATTVLSILSAIFTLAGSCSLILLTVFDVRRHPYIHYSNVSSFLLGYILAAACICAEKCLLSLSYPSNTILQRSFCIKLAFVVCEILLIVVFAATMFEGLYTASVVTEWVIGMLFAFYVSSFAMDFLSAVEEGGGDATSISYLRYHSWDEESVFILLPPKAYQAV